MNDKKIVFMFSGQGSQYFHMGRALYEKNSTFRHWMQHLDDLAARETGRSVIGHIYSDKFAKSDVLDDLSFSHPAIFMVEYALAKTLINIGIHPDLVLGSSLGSFAAAAVAGLVAADDALRAVLHHAAAFEAECEPGGMISILAEPDLFAEEFLSARSECAAVNLDTHFTISATRAALYGIEDELVRRNILYQRLPVNFGFHSRWIEPARTACLGFAIDMRGGPGRLPLMCCDRADLLSDLPGDYFWQVARRPIRMREAIDVLEKSGPHHYIDLGPSGTLSTFLKYLLGPTPASATHVTFTPYLDNLDTAALRAAVR